MRKVNRELVVEVFYGLGVMATICLGAYFLTIVYDTYVDPQQITTTLQCST